MTNYNDSVYSLGSQKKMTEEDCSYEALAREIYYMEFPETREYRGIELDSLQDDIEKIKNYFKRSGGLIDQIKKHLNVDLTLSNSDSFEFKCEKLKVLFLFYWAKKYEFEKVEIIQLLSKPSLENISIPPEFGTTQNGEYIDFFQENLSRETRPLLEWYLRRFFNSISKYWEDLCSIELTNLINGEETMERIDELIKTLSEVEYTFDGEYPQDSMFSPIENMLFIICKNEHIGLIKDIKFVNEYKNPNVYDVPTEMIPDMIKLYRSKITKDKIDSFIDNTNSIARYVYKKDNISKNDIDRITQQRDKVNKLLSFFYRSNYRNDVDNELNELYIISCLQAILLDKPDEIFDYIYPRYQKISSRKQHVGGALKGADKFVSTALKFYLTVKVNNHLYANMGKNSQWNKIRELQNVCDQILLNIFSCSNISDMKLMHKMYKHFL